MVLVRLQRNGIELVSLLMILATTSIGSGWMVVVVSLTEIDSSYASLHHQPQYSQGHDQAVTIITQNQFQKLLDQFQNHNLIQNQL